MFLEKDIKGPGMKELKDSIRKTSDAWEVETAFHVPSDFNDATQLWKMARSIVSVGLLKQRERIEELEGELNGLRQLSARLPAGFRPAFEYELHQEGGCYLFGCKQHGHPEWAD